MKAYFVILAASVGLIAGCSSSDTQTPSRTDACDISTDFAKRFVDDAERLRAEYEESPRNIAIEESPYALQPNITPNRPVEEPLRDSIPALADWRSITGLSDQSVLDACTDLESWASKEALITDDERISSLTTGEEWEAHVLSIAMPVFTSDGRHAVVFASKMAGGLAGVGVVAFYSKSEDGKWQLVGEEARWVA